jgi:zinc transporter ZupT
MAQLTMQRVLWVAVLTGLVAGAAAGAVLNFLIGGNHSVMAAGVAGGIVGVVVTNMISRDRARAAKDGEVDRA